MSRIKKKFIRYGTGTDDSNARDIPANFTPSNYTPTQVASEGTDKVSAHLKGIDNALTATAGDINHTTFTAADNQAVAANVTGLSFSVATVRGFKVLLSVQRALTYATYEFTGIQKTASWEMEQSLVGDDTGLTFTITALGQVQYVSTSTGNTAALSFRAQVVQV